MFIPRNRSLEAPTKDAILGSGILTQKTHLVHAFRGAEPTRDLSRVPQGVLVVLNEGFAFLAGGDHAIPGSALVQHLAVHIAAAKGPVGSIFSALLAGAKDFSHAEPTLSAALNESLDHPDTFVVPFAEIVETVYTPLGKFGIGRRDYTIVTRESARGERECFCLTPADGELADALLMLRFAAEKRAVRSNFLRAETDYAGIQHAVLQKFWAQYPSTLGDHRDEMVAEIMDHADTQLAARGSSLDRLETKVLDELGYFRTVPQFAKYFALAS